MRATAPTGAAITGHQSDDTASFDLGALRRGGGATEAPKLVYRQSEQSVAIKGRMNKEDLEYDVFYTQSFGLSILLSACRANEANNKLSSCTSFLSVGMAALA